MRNSMEVLCNKFVMYRDLLKQTNKMENTYIYPICASILSDTQKEVTEEDIRNCKALVNEGTSIFSNFRGNVKLPMVTMLAADENPQERLDKTLKVYDTLKEHFHRSEYLALVAVILAGMIPVEEAERYAARGKAIYDKMKKEHPFLTSGEDSVFAVLLAFSEKSDDALISDMEASYVSLKNKFSSSDSVQSLSQVLAFYEESPEVKCKKVEELFEALKNEGRKYGKYYELATLGAVAMLPVDVKVLTEEIIAVDEFLSNQKGYGGMIGIDKKTRLMHAVMIVASDYAENAQIKASALTGTMAMIAAQQAAVCCAVAATTAASAASHASN